MAAVERAPGDLLHGRRSDYILVKEIARGGTSSVWRVRSGTGAIFVAKLPSAHRFDLTASLLARLQREARLLEGIKNPHVVRVHDVVASEGTLAMVMEELPGGSLHDLLPGPMAEPAVARILAEAALGLAALHEAGIVHRDISPRNLMFAESGLLQVADLGAARQQSDDTITVEGDRLGSLLYVSPEQFDDPHNAKPDDDIYSLGQIGFELLTGVKPFGRTPRLDYTPLSSLVEDMRSPSRERRPAARDVVARVHGVGIRSLGLTGRWAGTWPRRWIIDEVVDDQLKALRTQHNSASRLDGLVLARGGPKLYNADLALSPMQELLTAIESRVAENDVAEPEDEGVRQFVRRLLECSSDPGGSLSFFITDSDLEFLSVADVAEALHARSPQRIVEWMAACGMCGGALDLVTREDSDSVDDRFTPVGLEPFARCPSCEEPRCPACGHPISLRSLSEPWNFVVAWQCHCTAAPDNFQSVGFRTVVRTVKTDALVPRR